MSWKPYAFTEHPYLSPSASPPSLYLCLSGQRECSVQFTNARSYHLYPPPSPQPTSGFYKFFLRQINMLGGDDGLPKATASPYEEAMNALSSLITKRTRADKSNKGDRFDLLFDYIKILDLEESISKMKIIHVAGTKGKGSTCTFSESILRNCGFHTGLFTSPHLIDVRERFRLDGVDICEEKFLAYFWWCYDRLKERTDEDTPMPTYFRFLALLAFKIFAAEQVDVAIMEVGLGGRFDATNVVQTPIVCGISSLGYDHMEILGNTLGEIAGEKAGIFKQGVPAFTVPQPDEAMHVLEEKASSLNALLPSLHLAAVPLTAGSWNSSNLVNEVNLQVAHPLDTKLLNGLQLGLDGAHQYINAGLAVALCSAWLHRTGHLEAPYLENISSLPEQFIRGLTTSSLQGRAQIVPDQYINTENHGDLVFYLDGAHSPESMEVCGRWFSLAMTEEERHLSSLIGPTSDNSGVSHGLIRRIHHESAKNSTQILLFNCMAVRDPQLLLPRLMKTCASHGLHFKQALFVPNISVYNKVITNVPAADSQVDVSWQLTLQRVWENLIIGEKGGDAKDVENSTEETEDELYNSVRHGTSSKVFPTLPLAIKWLRDSVQQNQAVRFQKTFSLDIMGNGKTEFHDFDQLKDLGLVASNPVLESLSVDAPAKKVDSYFEKRNYSASLFLDSSLVLVTGSLHLVGDVLRLIKK